MFGHDVWSMPPNSQGYLLLRALAIAEGLDLPASPHDPVWAHLLGRVRQGSPGTTGSTCCTRPPRTCSTRPRPPGGGRSSAGTPGCGCGLRPSLATRRTCGAVDADGMGVSLIQSNAAGFGSMIFELRTGINLHNRGIGFSLKPGHPRRVRPRQAPPHTLTPALITRRDGTLRSVAGTMGGDAQPQILLQVVTRLLLHGEEPGQAISAPRWRPGHRRHRVRHLGLPRRLRARPGGGRELGRRPGGGRAPGGGAAVRELVRPRPPDRRAFRRDAGRRRRPAFARRIRDWTLTVRVSEPHHGYGRHHPHHAGPQGS
ncbi:gamma-glutamyltransferase [Nonomuraea rubra]|uniref:gamma-glutamyltransferase n=1 Tax=Nonomuraea rubra TaxID=46180 RepID=UPI0031E59A69